MKRIVAFVALIVAAACKNSVEGAIGSAVGNYTLIGVDNSPIPFSTGTNFIVRGTLNLKNGGDFTLTQADSATGGIVTNTSVSGSWSTTDNALALIPSVGSLELGLVTIDTVRLTRSGRQQLYVRR